MSHDPALRVFLIARALRVPCESGTRLMSCAEVDFLVSVLRRRWVPSLDDFFGGFLVNQYAAESYYCALIVPLMDKRGLWSFSSEYNSPTLLRTFWRAVVELVFRLGVRAHSCHLDRHPLIFHSLSGDYEIEVSDDRGDEWYCIVHSAHERVDDARSSAGTPDNGALYEALINA